MNLLLTVVLTAVEPGPEPEDVKAGWVAFGIFLLMAAAVVFLAFSLRKQLKKVTFDEGDGPEDRDPAAPADPSTTP